ncbi:S16 family serine protease [Paenibacillus yanchengensis]|uniref:S16 family serine protease n=1 Tax=Paenibacillus yanchengensis TaxID=2035833 RepID=A0ABW4YMA1_9BACL
MRKKISIWRNVLLGIVVSACGMWLLLYSTTPFVIYEPGIAVPVHSMIEVGVEPQTESDGEWLITAVKLTEPNFLYTIAAIFDADKSVKLKKTVFQGQSKRQYANYLNVVMNSSQHAAIEAAYRYAGIPYTNQLAAITVTEVVQQSLKNSELHTTDVVFQVGDQLLGIVDEQAFTSLDDMVARLIPGRHGQIFEIEVMRGSDVLVIPIQLNPPDDEEWTVETLARQLSIASFTETRKLVPDQLENKVVIRASDIGGPSAGFVFALQIVDLLSEEDLTSGLHIAATGTITEAGMVGAIGGIEQKVTITSRQGADIFLVPKYNEPAALKKARAIGTDMVVIGVESLDEALAVIKLQKQH